MHRVLHVGLGPLGRKMVTDLVSRGLGRVVAAVDVSPEVAGRSLESIAPGAGGGVTVARSLDEVRCWDQIDAAVVTTSSDVPSCADTFRALLAKGLPVVSTCEELVYPKLRHAALADELDALAKKSGGRLLGTGVNPGFLMDTLPVAITAVCRSVRAVRVYRVQDASTRRVPFQAKIGATLDDGEFGRRVAKGTLRHVGLGESLHFISACLGLGVERWNETIEPVRATRDLACTLGAIPAGRIAGVRQVAQGWRGTECVVYLEFVAAIGQEEPHDRVVIEGEPGIDMTIAGGVHGDIATSAITLNAISALKAAAPGLHTMASIRPVRCGS